MLVTFYLFLRDDRENPSDHNELGYYYHGKSTFHSSLGMKALLKILHQKNEDEIRELGIRIIDSGNIKYSIDEFTEFLDKKITKIVPYEGV